MLLQGDLQSIFDALYGLGVIDPVLNMDWGKEFGDMEEGYQTLDDAIIVASRSSGDVEDLMTKLRQFDQHTLGHLAMVVAKELVGFHTNAVVH